jgi:hypothetical protein
LINVKDYVTADGVTDDTANFQALINSVPARETLYIPTGHYVVTNTLDCGTKGLTFKGDGQGRPGNQYQGGSVLRGSVAGPLLRSAYPASGVTAMDLGFSNYNPAGVGLEVGGNTIVLERLSVTAFKGITGPANTFTVVIQGVQVTCTTPQAPVGSVGIQVAGHAMIQGADVVGFDHAIRACGVGVSIRSCRIEVNRTGLMLGLTAAGGNSNLTGASIEAISFEANDVAIDCRIVSGASFRGITIQGTVNSPSAGSQRGIYAGIAKAAEFQGIVVSGGFSEAAVKIPAQDGTQRWANCIVSNTNSSAKVWDIQSMKGLSFEQCA